MTNDKYKIALVLGLALVLRVIFLSESLLCNPTFFAPIIDAYTYNKLALAEVLGGGMGPESVWQPLFYPYFLSICYYAFGYGFLSVRIIQIALSLLTCALTYIIGRNLFGRNAGLLAAALIAVSGPLIFYEGELLPTTWEVFWFLGSLFLFQEWGPPRGGRALVRFGVLGFVCGMGVMLRPVIVPFYLAALVTCIVRNSRESWGQAAGLAGATLCGAALVFAPVLVRNHSLTERWILLPLSGGLNFYIGNNPEADKTVAIRPGDQWYQLTVSPRREGIFLSPEGPGYFYRKAFEYIRDNPTAFLKGLGKKAELLFSAREIPRNIDIYLFRDYSAVLKLLVWRAGGFGFPMGIIIPLALFGVAVNLRRFQRLAYLYLFVIAYSVSIVLFFVSTRYRLPLLPALCLFAASGVGYVYEKWKRVERAGLFPSLALLAVLFAFCNRALKIPEDSVNFESELYMALGTVHLERGEGAEGERYLEKSVEIAPGNADAHNLLGLLKFQEGELDRAGEELGKAIELQPTHVGALKNLGRLYQRTQKWDRARECYLKAVALDPGSDEIHFDLAGLYEETGDVQAAALEYWRALELRPDGIAIRRKLSMLLGRMGRWETARELIAEAVRHEPEDAGLRCDLGVIYAGMGKPASALAEFERALRARPGFPLALLNMGIVYARMGDRVKAEEQYRKLKPIDPSMADQLAELIHP
jgi:tetratricopeptide (TPR) repeat protein